VDGRAACCRATAAGELRLSRARCEGRVPRGRLMSPAFLGAEAVDTVFRAERALTLAERGGKCLERSCGEAATGEAHRRRRWKLSGGGAAVMERH
jgi:hypothetical protein